jgi:hypothetical protein
MFFNVFFGRNWVLVPVLTIKRKFWEFFLCFFMGFGTGTKCEKRRLSAFDDIQYYKSELF